MNLFKVMYSLSLILFLFSCRNLDTSVDKSKLLGNDYRLFQHTLAWDLAKAVKNGDINKIKAQILDKGVKIDFQEPRFGNTLLMLAITNNEYASVKTLLELGADPNLADKYRGSTAVIDAANNENPNFIKLILSCKGDPNAKETAPVKEGDEARETALNKAISIKDINSLEKVKCLVEAGADINYSNDDNPAYTELPLADALIKEKMDVAVYLLLKGVDYKRAMYKTIDGHDVYILEALRKCILDLGTKDYKKKMEIVEFLKRKGLDYKKEPIPDYVLRNIKKRYPDSWKDYVRKY